jgi:hypothetical protein
MQAGLNFRLNNADAMNKTSTEDLLTALPKAELHVHLEGSIEPPTVVELAARHGVSLTVEEATARYAPGNFAQFIESFIWVTSFLRGPEDYALISRRFAESLRRQNVLYAEVTLSAASSWRSPSMDIRRSAAMGRGPSDGSSEDSRGIKFARYRRVRNRRR